MEDALLTALGTIDEKNTSRLQRLGVASDTQTLEAAMMVMVSALGELATLSYRSTTTMSPFEHAEASNVIGRMIVALSTIGHCLDVNVAAAALGVLGEKPQPGLHGAGAAGRGDGSQTQAAGERPPSASVARSSPGPADAGAPAAGHVDPGVSSMPRQPVILSPNSREAFFTYLDQLATAPKETVERADLRWVVPDTDGALVELIPNGARALVAHDLFPTYYDMAQNWRAEQQSRQVEASRAASAPLMTVVPGYNAAKEASMFSPTHFSGGLFSPRAADSPGDLLRADVRPPTAFTAGPQRSSSVEAATPAVAYPAFASVGASAGLQPASQPRQSSPSAAQPPSPMTAEEFNLLVNYLRFGAVTGQQIARLGLTFSYVAGDRVVELVKDGLQILVTAANCHEFLRMLDEARASAKPPAPERVHRANSIRRLQPMVPVPESAAEGFSPSHFNHGLFSPFERRSTFYVDYDAGEQTLPAYLKLKSQQSMQQAAHGGAAGGYAATPTSSSYMTAVRSNDFGALLRILREVKVSPHALSTHGVTFCVPSALVPNSTPSEKLSGVHELFPGSAERVVTPGEEAVFFGFVSQFLGSAI